MPTDITITNITGSSPYDIYLCDDPVVTCVYINTITTLPYGFQIPPVLDGQTSYNLKVVDNDNCIKITNLTP